MFAAKALALVLSFSILLTSCGTLFTGTSEMFTISSEPGKGKVYVDGVYMGVSPVTTSLKKDKDHAIRVSLEGYEDASAVVTRSFNPVAILNTIGLLCWVVDFVTGGAWKFDTQGVTVRLEKKSSARMLNDVESVEGLVVKKTDNGKTYIYSY